MAHTKYMIGQQPALKAPRPLWAAVAHCLEAASIKDQARQALLGRIFRTLRPADQMRCRIELDAIRALRRERRSFYEV